MKLASCGHEREVRELIASGQWPAACPPELRAHVSRCRACGDLVLVSEVFRQARAESVAAARPVSPALLMWRAQLRRRNAAVERLGRPLLGAQIFAFAVVAVAALGFLGFEARGGAEWLTLGYWRDWLAQLPQIAVLQWESLNSGASAGGGWGWMVLASALASLVLLGSVAVYLATDKS
ncbi:MAG: hypothetical protein ACP5E2_12675 [Terracidiphilus sp.]